MSRDQNLADQRWNAAQEDAKAESATAANAAREYEIRRPARKIQTLTDDDLAAIAAQEQGQRDSFNGKLDRFLTRLLGPGYAGYEDDDAEASKKAANPIYVTPQERDFRGQLSSMVEYANNQGGGRDIPSQYFRASDWVLNDYTGGLDRQYLSKYRRTYDACTGVAKENPNTRGWQQLRNPETFGKFVTGWVNMKYSNRSPENCY